MQNQTDESSLILASRSPRRKYLLRKAGLSFSVIPSAVDESGIRADNPDELVRFLAEAKALEIAGKYPESWVIGADTVVVIGKNILGKPASEAQAAEMLRQLSGRIHRVLTGYAICCQARDRMHSETVSTDVLFKNLSEEEIQWYVDTKEPFDKAGAYAIQGLGTFLVKSINGSYTNVVGLPVCEVVEFLIREKAVALRGGRIK
ncbi:MAG: Maf family protein [Desulfobacterales bacterium]|nr:Maf family protein [Desulfobacterales bacterium]MDD3082837.1 Maf family protein [Desulfobacterales bacterium]MDD3951987.1 Maf family protein [Desulfobacterales bacterium]MDD4464774.1 Maf family protein [Desulfobacterales bacterium]